MADPALASALAEYAQEKGEVVFNELVALRDAAWAKIIAGGGEQNFVQSTSMNGKSVTFSREATCNAVFAWAHAAIREFRGQNARSTEADFSGLTDL